MEEERKEEEDMGWEGDDREGPEEESECDREREGERGYSKPERDQ